MQFDVSHIGGGEYSKCHLFPQAQHWNGVFRGASFSRRNSVQNKGQVVYSARRVFCKMGFRTTLLFSLFAALCFLGAVGCRTVPPLPPVNLDEKGWTLKEGQAVWRRGAQLDLAGEVLIGLSPDCAMVQFTKGPIPVVVARREGEVWEARFPMQNRRYSGRGTPPARLAWLQLARALAGEPLARGWTWETNGGAWKLQSRNESITGAFTQ
jgi:hypothetical protein